MNVPEDLWLDIQSSLKVKYRKDLKYYPKFKIFCLISHLMSVTNAAERT